MRNLLLGFVFSVAPGAAPCFASVHDGAVRRQVIHSAVTFGAGQVRYVDGRAVSTNRRLLNRYLRTEGLPASEFKRDRTEPVPFPPASQSEARLSRADDGRVVLHVAEHWDLFQASAAGGYFGEANFGFHHDVPVAFTAGDWDDFLAGRPVTLRTTLEGARQAAADLAEIVGLSTISKSRRPLPNAIKTESELLADLCEALFSTAASERKREALAEGSPLNSLLHRPDGKNRYEVTGATPKLVIEVSGRRDDMTVKYLNDVLVEATGYVSP